MPKEKKDKHFIHKPVYPGGLQAMKKFISENLVYPEKAATAGIKGTVTIDYTVDYKGNVIETKVISSLGFGCDEEAVRLVKLLKFDVPKQRIQRIRFHKTINIHFRPPAKKKSPSKLKSSETTHPPIVHYEITKGTKNEKEKSQKDNDSGYSYTIQF